MQEAMKEALFSATISIFLLIGAHKIHGLSLQQTCVLFKQGLSGLGKSHTN